MRWARAPEHVGLDNVYAYTGTGMQRYVYKAIHIHTCEYTHTFAHASTHTHSPAPKHTCARCLYMQIHTRMHNHTKVIPLHTPAGIHVHMHACVLAPRNPHVCTQLHMYLYTHAPLCTYPHHIHTFTHLHTCLYTPVYTGTGFVCGQVVS